LFLERDSRRSFSFCYRSPGRVPSLFCAGRFSCVLFLRVRFPTRRFCPHPPMVLRFSVRAPIGKLHQEDPQPPNQFFVQKDLSRSGGACSKCLLRTPPPTIRFSCLPPVHSSPLSLSRLGLPYFHQIVSHFQAPSLIISLPPDLFDLPKRYFWRRRTLRLVSSATNLLPYHFVSLFLRFS